MTKINAGPSRRTFLFVGCCVPLAVRFAEAAPPEETNPLIRAVQEGKPEDVVRLLGEKVDVNVRDQSGGTALMWAVALGRKDIVQVLLDHKADPEAATPDGATPLMAAAAAGYPAVVRLLLDKGAKVNARDSLFGNTPLMWAARAGHEEIVRILLNAGADVNIANKEGKTVRQLVGDTPLESLEGLLKEHGGRRN